MKEKEKEDKSVYTDCVCVCVCVCVSECVCDCECVSECMCEWGWEKGNIHDRSFGSKAMYLNILLYYTHRKQTKRKVH